MNARLKLNSANIQGALIVAGLVGWAFGSWIVFIAVAAVLLASAHYEGSIRRTPKARK